ncbi:MAG: glycosyltransferase family 39 protein [Anaerolineales bacterium]|nr:glycosyltransferase family 39 protein [Anaerolineales bacterium]
MTHQKPLSQKSNPSIINYLPLLVLLLAACLRFYHLPALPPGLNFDEAGNGVAALDILDGRPLLWWRIGGGKEPLWPYLIALSTAILGPVPLALRLPAALCGLLTVAAVYPLARVLFRSRYLALLAMLGLALSDWHLHFSRLGFRAVLFPLFSALAGYFFWEAFSRLTRPPTTDRRPPNKARQLSQRPSFLSSFFILHSSFFTALAIYSYLAARLLPLVFISFCLLYWLRSRRNFRPLFILISTFFILTALFLLPLIIHFALSPADLLARASTVSIFNPEWNHGDLLSAVWQTLTLTLSTFLGLHGDANPLVNLPDQPTIPFFLTPFFLLGLATALYYTLNPPFTHHQPPITRYQSPISNLQSPSPHLFLLSWWLVMLLPALLAPEGAPHHLRLLGAIIPTYIFIAMGVTSIVYFITRILSRPTRNYQLSIINYQLLVPLLLYTILAFHTMTNYFIRWPNATDFTLPFDLYATRLAADIAQAPPGIGYVLPMDIRAADEARHYTIDYLLADHPNAAYTYLPVDERNAERWLTQAAQGQTQLRVVRWTNDKHREADAKEIVTFLLEINGDLTGHESYPVYDVDTYTLIGQPAFTLPAIDHPIGADFDGLLRLDAAYVSPQIAPGDDLPVALTLAPLAPMTTDYKASIRLIGPAGETIAQKDRQLQHNFHQGTSLWPPETVNEYYLLPAPPETPPGDYVVKVVLYQPDTLAPLVANGVVEVPIGKVIVTEGHRGY